VVAFACASQNLTPDVESPAEASQSPSAWARPNPAQLTSRIICAHIILVIELAAASRPSTAAPREFFARWVDHGTWRQWSPDTQWARIDGPVQLGARGVLKPVGGPKTKFTVSEYEPDRVYTDVSSFPGAGLTFRHTVEPAGSGSVLTVRVWLNGPLAWFWARTACKGFAASVPKDLDRLIELVEASS
jgi:hypothetical protein